MTTTETPAPGPAAQQPRPVRRARRPVQGRMIGGVAAGLADHLGLDVFWVRLAFVASSWFNGVGVLVYVALWRLLPQGDPDEPEQPAGLASATRRGLRTTPRSPRLAGGDLGQTIALIALGIGVLMLQQYLGWGLGSLMWPLVIAVVGVALVWRQADDAQRQRWTATSPDVPILGLLLGSGGWAAVVRLGLGAVLLTLALVFLVAQSQGTETLGPVAAGTLLAVLGIALLLGPWIHRLGRDLAAERRERIRSQERADMAAHLHDSVLQTLALLQRHADNPRTVARLARRQERELREWLYADTAPDGATLRAALRSVAAEVEDLHDVTVEVVGVGDDVPMSDALTALVRAAGEAMVNAAKHSGAGHVDVYAETAGAQVEVFVRDRGCGFDPETIAEGRLGVRESIRGRMERHGGTAVIRSAPGEGTEVRLSMTLPDRDEESAR